MISPRCVQVLILSLSLAGTYAFAPSAWHGLGNRKSTRAFKSWGFDVSMSAVASEKPGTGQNRMTTSSFTTPLVEKVAVPSSQEYEWKVRTDLLDPKKLNLQEKVKLAKPGLSIIDQLELLAAEAKEKGGAQVNSNPKRPF